MPCIHQRLQKSYMYSFYQFCFSNSSNQHVERWPQKIPSLRAISYLRLIFLHACSSSSIFIIIIILHQGLSLCNSLTSFFLNFIYLFILFIDKLEGPKTSKSVTFFFLFFFVFQIIEKLVVQRRWYKFIEILYFLFLCFVSSERETQFNSIKADC